MWKMKKSLHFCDSGHGNSKRNQSGGLARQLKTVWAGGFEVVFALSRKYLACNANGHTCWGWFDNKHKWLMRSYFMMQWQDMEQIIRECFHSMECLYKNLTVVLSQDALRYPHQIGSFDLLSLIWVYQRSNYNLPFKKKKKVQIIKVFLGGEGVKSDWDLWFWP